MQPESEEQLQELWKKYKEEKTVSSLSQYVKVFLEKHQHLVDLEFTQLTEESILSVEDGPNLSDLPDGFLQCFGFFLCQTRDHCLEHLSLTKDTLYFSIDIMKCLIIICRNLDNIPLLASCSHVNYIITITSTAINKLCESPADDEKCGLLLLVHHVLHLLECLYDPYFVWRRRLRKWKVDKSTLLFLPALLHDEIVPFLYECFQLVKLDISVQVRMLHLFGSVMSGGQANALKVICPATLDILLQVLASSLLTSAEEQSGGDVQTVASKCFVRMVHVLHCASPDKRQIEVSAVLEGLLGILFKNHTEIEYKKQVQMHFKILNELPAMLDCRDKPALQVTFVSVGIFDKLIEYLNNTQLFGGEAHKLAIAILHIVSGIMAGCGMAKERFLEDVGFPKFIEALKHLGQPSKELLLALLDLVVEGHFEASHHQTIKNPQLLLKLLIWLPDIQCHELQKWLADSLTALCSTGVHNKRQCCREGMVGAVLQVLRQEKQMDAETFACLVGLLEKLGSHSISAADLKQLMSLFKEEEVGYRHEPRMQLMHALSSMAKKEGRENAQHYFDLQHPDAGISFPGIRKWPGHCFAFHAWLCLASVFEKVRNCRYQLYSFHTTAGSGFEAFLTHDGVLVVAVSTAKEYLTISLEESPIQDTEWHSIDIVYINAKKPFGQSQLIVYIDGQQKMVTQMKFPSLTEPLTCCRIGSRGLHSHVVDVPVPEPRVNKSKLRMSLEGLFHKEEESNANSIRAGTQVYDINCSDHGPNALLTFMKHEDSEIADLAGKLVLYYNAKACQGNICIDLSPKLNHGRLTGHHCVTCDVKDVINCIGGIQVLFPLLEQANEASISIPVSPVLNDMLSPPDEMAGDWVVLPDSTYADSHLEKNYVAGFLGLVRNMLQNNRVNQENMIQTNGMAVIGALLQKVPVAVIDVRVLMSVQLLTECVASSNEQLLHQLYQYVLFDFRIWSHCEFQVRIGHVQYLSTIMKEDKRYFRKKYGAQYMLDTIRTYYSSSSECQLLPADAKTIRVAFFRLIHYFVQKDISHKEMTCIINFITSVKDEVLVGEALDMLLGLLECHHAQSQVFLLLFEPENADLLYALLTKKDFTPATKEKVVRIIGDLLKTDKVYERSKGRLHLYNIGYAGLVSQMEEMDITLPMVQGLLEQSTLADVPATYTSLLSVLQLVPHGDVDMKLAASREVLSVLMNRPGAAKKIVQQVGWQETLVTLLTLHPKTIMSMGSFSDDVSAIIRDSGIDDCSATTTGQESDSNLPVEFCLNDSQAENLDSNGTVLACQGQLEASVSDIGTGSPMFSKMADYFAEDAENDFDNGASCERSRSLSGGDTIDGYNGDRYLSARESTASLASEASTVNPEDSVSQISTELPPKSPASPKRSPAGSRISGFFSRSMSTSQDELEETLPEKVEKKMQTHSIEVEPCHSKESELMQNVLISLLCVLWEGVEGSDSEAWKVRGQVFSSIKYLARRCELVMESRIIQRKLIEMMLKACRTQLLHAGQAVADYTENAAQLIKIVHHFLMQETPDKLLGYSEAIIESVTAMFDVLNVWDEAMEWTEMSHIGLDILLAFCATDSVEFCAIAAARLHTILHSRTVKTEEEALYLMGSVNDVIEQAITDNTDQYSFMLPVLKALLMKCPTLLDVRLYLPNCPITSRPSFFDDFKLYAQTEEWKTYIARVVTQGRKKFTSQTFEEGKKTITDYLRNCHEEMMVGIHKRNRERGESKLSFEKEILEPFRNRGKQETNRYNNIMTQMHNQHSSVLRQWRSTKNFFMGERGAWSEKDIPDVHWKLSNHENFSRMRPKLIQNYNFDLHTEASRARDNLGPDLQQQALEPHSDTPLDVLKEVKVSQDKIGDDRLGDEEWRIISSASEGATEELTGKEKLIFSENCELITLVDVIPGRLELTSSFLYFFDCRPNKEEGTGEDFKLSLVQLREIHFRRYNLRRSALEIFLVDQTNYFLNFQQKVRNKVFSRVVSARPPNLIYKVSRSPAELLKASGLTQKWVHREISNFDYLMQLNTIAGRTYNDLNQYPVFPWILKDYTSENLDLTDPNIYRDLTKPIGIQNPKNEAEVIEKYEHFEDPSGTIEKFHYGTHYSSAAAVMHYLVRLEPFTTLHIDLQSGRFDVSDRQFHSVPGAWRTLMENPNDVKELIPEFFYLPEFLVNSNGFDLGKLQVSNKEVNDVQLPAWAQTPEEFISKHRDALESDYVSAYLHEWIDLIFGYKQKGPAAVEAVNVFWYCTYEGAVDLDAIKNPIERKAVEGMINNFGQTPCQLLKEPHPKRLTFEETMQHSIRTDRPLSVLHFLSHLKAFFVKVSEEDDPLIFVSVPRNQARSFIQHGTPDKMVTVSEQGILGLHEWLPYDKSISNYFTFEKDRTYGIPKRRQAGPFSPDIRVTSKLFAASHDAKLFFSGGHWDNSLRVYSIDKYKMVGHITRHEDVITCVALDYCGTHLMTGSRDTTCMIWQVAFQSGASSGLDSKPLQVLYGHDKEVTCIAISVELDMAVSGSKDGTIIVHTVRKGMYMHTLRPPCEDPSSLEIHQLGVSYVGHIITYSTVQLPDKKQGYLHAYSVNGKHFTTEKLSYYISHMALTGDHLLVGNSQGTLIIKALFGLTTLTTLPLHIPIRSISITNGNSHILVALNDGKLIVVGIKRPSEVKGSLALLQKDISARLARFTENS
ncbi:neurobeachin-like protein 1 [Lingula anatina]|uniref:Neurobeachin-like protein 1 n=1 Tax=Lingula anatina TaxID=7574 RepID=A0A1S3HHL5_LINAN|nr:neurobeachin-like protein 1 [Lingula anatina]|eukprot:XP_013384976.1 neurobeachin-like protein 1 [Lingula anatina]